MRMRIHTLIHIHHMATSTARRFYLPMSTRLNITIILCRRPLGLTKALFQPRLQLQPPKPIIRRQFIDTTRCTTTILIITHITQITPTISTTFTIMDILVSSGTVMDMDMVMDTDTDTDMDTVMGTDIHIMATGTCIITMFTTTATIFIPMGMATLPRGREVLLLTG
jgi:hypothetical protein